MADTVVLHFHDSQIGQVSWHPVGKHPTPMTPRGTGSLEQAAEQLKGRRLVAIVPSSDMLITSVAIPSRNKQRLVQAIPYALENDLTEEIEQLHFAFDPRSDREVTSVAVISRQRLKTWMQQLSSLDLQPLALYPDLLCLPLSEGHWTLYVDRDHAWVRSGKNAGFFSEPENLAELLRMRLRESPTEPEQIDLYLAPGLDKRSVSTALQDIDVDTVQIESEGQPGAFLAENLDEKNTLNLLQGEFQQVDQKAVQWRRWLPAAALFTLLIAINIVSSVIDYRHYQQQSVVLENEIRRVFRETFPDTKRIVDPKIQMEQQLRILKSDQKGGRASFLSLLLQPAATLSKTPGSRLESISYRDDQLDLKLILNDLESLEAIRKSIESDPDLSVEIKSANASGKQITSHLRIKGARP